MVGGADEICPPDSVWGMALQGVSVCPREVTGTTAPKNNAPRSGCQKGAMGPETGGLLALVGGAGEVRLLDMNWGETLRGISGPFLRVAGASPPKNNSPKVGVPKPPQRNKA